MDTICPLCADLEESVDHIFYKCEVSWWLLREGLSKIGNVLNTHNRRISFDDISGLINSLPTHSKIWALHWTFLTALSWSIWKERKLRNNRLKRGKSCSNEIILKSCLDMVQYGFIEARAAWTWS